MTRIRAFFYTAQDARRALNALQQEHVEAQGPTSMPAPQNGRPWLLEIEVRSGSSSTMNPDPVLLDRAVAVVRRFNGLTAQGDTFA